MDLKSLSSFLKASPLTGRDRFLNAKSGSSPICIIALSVSANLCDRFDLKTNYVIDFKNSHGKYDYKFSSNDSQKII
jgi:hypothetical protein